MRVAIRIVVAAVAALVVPVAAAGEIPPAQTPRNFPIAAPPLSRGLLEFSRQADLIVTAPAALVGDKRAPEIRGQLTPSAALSQLLRGSGLEASFTASGAVTIDNARRVARQPTRAPSTAASASESSGDVLIEE